MLIALAVIALIVVLNIGLQTTATRLVIQYALYFSSGSRLLGRRLAVSLHLSVVMFILFANHLLQIGIWALAFIISGQFELYRTAYYHSAVNFTTLGYGDIVMDEPWRLLGAIEAANGVLMFGVSTAVLFSVISNLLKHEYAIHLKPSPEHDTRPQA